MLCVYSRGKLHHTLFVAPLPGIHLQALVLHITRSLNLVWFPIHPYNCRYLSNMDELKERYADVMDGHPDSPTAVVNPNARDPCEAFAKIIFAMYTKTGSEPLVLLSELQGQYTFVLYDGEKKQVFLARDSSEKEPLYYEIEDSGAINVSNALLSVPSDVGQVHWSQLPPGHLIAGKSPKLQQFALTPKQLSIREWYETLDDDLSPHAGDGSSSKRSLSEELADVTIEN